MILYPNCSDHVSTLIMTKDRNYTDKDDKVFNHHFEKDGFLEYTIDYDNFTFKELLVMVRPLLHFANIIRIKHFYRPMNKEIEMFIDFTVYSDKSLLVPKIEKIELNQFNNNFLKEMKDAGFYNYPLFFQGEKVTEQNIISLMTIDKL